MIMLHLYPKITKFKKSIALYLHAKGSGIDEFNLLKVGDMTVVEGGSATGKTEFLQKIMLKLQENNEKYIYINGSMPVGDWVKEYTLFGKNLEAKLLMFFRSLPDKYYLLIDDAEKIIESRKLDTALKLLEKTRGGIITCDNFTHLTSKLKVRLKDSKLHSLGAGADTFDVTYFLLAGVIVGLALVGAVNLIFIVAAMRYLFQGSRIGGKI